MTPERTPTTEVAALEQGRGFHDELRIMSALPTNDRKNLLRDTRRGVTLAGMTFANQITLVRILLIPVFVVFAVYYAESVRSELPIAWLRWWAIAVFVIAAASDALDGWVVRRFNQRSALGVVLDPIADKGLLLTAIITLSLFPWTVGLPLWFPVLVIARDVVILVGCGLLKFFTGDVEVRPSMLGKIATALQMTAVAWVMLQIPSQQWVVYAAGFFTLVSGIGYIWRGMGALGGAGKPAGEL